LKNVERMVRYKKHTVTLEDGTEIELSNESYENLKRERKA